MREDFLTLVAFVPDQLLDDFLLRLIWIFVELILLHVVCL